MMTKTSTTLYVEESGAANATTLVFLHGGGGAGWMWKPQVEALSQDYHCLVPDLPGHGRSMDTTFTMVDAAQRVATLITERAHGGKAVVIGLSLGAQVLVQLLATAPQTAARAVISSALVRPMGPGWLYAPSVLRWSYHLGVTPFKSSQWYTRLNMRSAAGVPDAYFTQFNEDYQRMTADSFAQVIHENSCFRLPTGLDKVTVPALVVVGKREYGVMKQSARDLLNVLPNARGVVVDVGRSTAENHNWNLNAPELFTRLLRAWIADQPLPAELAPLTA
ncbi:MAG: alpha/beta hydrolase [Anaerolineae bacterium]